MEKVKININAELDLDKYQVLVSLLKDWGIEVPCCEPECVILPVSLVCNIPYERDAYSADLYIMLTGEEAQELKSKDGVSRRELVKEILLSRIRAWLLTEEGVTENAGSCWDFNWGDALQFIPSMEGISFNQPVSLIGQILPFETLVVDHDEYLAQEDVPGIWSYRLNGVDSQPYPVNIDMMNGEVWTNEDLPDDIPDDAERFVTLSNGVVIPCDEDWNLNP